MLTATPIGRSNFGGPGGADPQDGNQSELEFFSDRTATVTFN